jgi:hypothetical protein
MHYFFCMICVICMFFLFFLSVVQYERDLSINVWSLSLTSALTTPLLSHAQLSQLQHKLSTHVGYAPNLAHHTTAQTQSNNTVDAFPTQVNLKLTLQNQLASLADADATIQSKLNQITEKIRSLLHPQTTKKPTTRGTYSCLLTLLSTYAWITTK